jgi:2-polyprenyl-6-hydroxyphenyl methylase/3-demethylubiquinone-9 3-methyltransferase
MAIQQDPDGKELEALFRTTGSLAGKRILEIGCGDGRLTRHLAGQAQSVTGIDPSGEKISRARESIPAGLPAQVDFYDLGLEEYSILQPPGEKFDLALLSWSL